MWSVILAVCIFLSTCIYGYALILEHQKRKRQKEIFPLVFHNGILMAYGPNSDYTVDSNGIVHFLFRQQRQSVVQIIYGDGRRSSDPGLYQYLPPPPPIPGSAITVTRIPLDPPPAAPVPRYSRWVETAVEQPESRTPQPGPEVPAEERYNRDIEIGE